MKTRLIIALLFLSAAFAARGQLTLEQTYDHSLTSTRINATGYMYYLMDVANSQCRIYRTDHSLYKTITISLPADHYLQDIKFVTENLFNSDASVELWYSAYNWVPVGDTGYYRYVSKVVNEQGTVLADIPNGAYAYIIPAGDEVYKLVVYSYDNSFWPGSVRTSVFALPSTPTAAWHVSAMAGDPYPNPADGAVNIPVPSGIGEGTINVFSITGEAIYKETFRGGEALRIDTSGWAPGVYTYRMETAAGVVGSRKLVIR